MNIMRVGHQMKLIDLDASVSFISGNEFSGLKFSSGYVCPELIFCSESVACVRSKNIDPYMHDENSIRKYQMTDSDLVVAAEAHDLWSLGVVIYNICVNAPLFLCDGDGNIEESDLRLLAEWSDVLKIEKLSRVKNLAARNLISLLLSKDPRKRPSVKHVLVHPFLTGKRVSKLIGDGAEFDVFLSYRVNSDAKHAEMLYDMLTASGVTVWWDRVCLKPGEAWDVGFCIGLLKSKVFLPIISQDAISSFKNLTGDSSCDNLLLEYVLALELKERGCIDKIFPLFIGRKDSATEQYDKYTFNGDNPCHPQNLPDVSVSSVETRLIERIDDLGLGLPFIETMAVTDIVTSVLKYQGRFVEGDLNQSMEGIVKHSLTMFAKSAPTPPKSSAKPYFHTGDSLSQNNSAFNSQNTSTKSINFKNIPIEPRNRVNRLPSYRLDAAIL
jgi:serine/threonine protein kinase